MNEDPLSNGFDLRKQPAVWTFAACWIIAALRLWSVGHWRPVAVYSGALLGVVLFSWLTVRITETPPDYADPDRGDNEDGTWKLWVGVVLIAAVILNTMGLLPWWVLPGTEQVEQWFGKTAERLGLPYNYGRNPVAYCLIPLVFLVPLTRFRHLGIQQGHRTANVVALWCTIPLLVAVESLLSGATTLGKYWQTVISNTMQNGPWEEFLFRGALQTRLVMLLKAPWGIVLTSLLFGIWHFPAQLQYADGSLGVAVARTIIMQATLGLSFGIIYWRTRNLAACSVCHVIFNTVI